MLTGEFRFDPHKTFGIERKKRKPKNDKKKNSATYKTTVDEELQKRKDIVKEYLVTNNRNWGKISAMRLAAETHDGQIISHDLCWKIIQKVWRNGKIRPQARILA